SLLATAAPSFNVNAQPISDAGTMVRPANLRGLSPDSTLILVNGKRRHRAAVISFLGGGISDGAQGPDISAIPAIALKQVEVLRDGASAQYGSDAIAGVINFVLKDNASGGTVELKTGSYAEGDGDQVTIAGNVGLPLTDAGFANFSYELNNQDATDRSVQRDDAIALINAGNVGVADPAQIWGNPEIKDDMKIFMNVGLDLGNGKEAYMFGNWSERTVDGGFFFRNPHNRSGVYGTNVYDDNGTPNDTSDDILLGYDAIVGDLTPDGSGACPAIFTPVGQSILDQAAFLQVAADPNCFTFAEMIPEGFTPRFGGDVTDVSLVIGTRGEFAGGTTYDYSVSVGQSQADFRIRNTVNASLGPNTPREFRPGSYTQLEKSANADFSTEVSQTTFMAYGVEFREESFEITNGDYNSFVIGPLADQGFSIGSNGFQGFKPQDAGVFTRRSKAAYVDFEFDLSEGHVVNFALRGEDFSDFGSTSDFKLSGMHELSDSLKARWSVSTGFRAPTTGQSNVSNVSTSFSPTGGLQEIATLSPTNPVSVELGAQPLQPEESDSTTFGLVYESGDFFLTVDFFDIAVDGRISQTSDQEVTPAHKAALINDGILDAVNLAAIRWFTNDFDSETSGVDIVANYSHDAFGGEMKYAFAANITSTEIFVERADLNGDGVIDPDEIVGPTSLTKIRQLEENLPETRFSFTSTYESDDWSLMARLNYYGEFYEAHLDSGDLGIDVGAATLLDAEFRYNVNKDLTLTLGSNNLTDEYPDENPYGAAVAGAKYPVTSPFGFNGRFVYGKATYRF
ncbi:MAG: TonB-dependent receptor, partial [Gammaproteobacteria bacterium]|nr:TonB-dependent receptor [Gammaproteobacteria bacterium]